MPGMKYDIYIMQDKSTRKLLKQTQTYIKPTSVLTNTEPV